MTAQEIKSMIDHYGLVRHYDKLRITRNQDEAKANLETIKSAKQAIFSTDNKKKKNCIFFAFF